jgi:hypothetical protein
MSNTKVQHKAALLAVGSAFAAPIRVPVAG